MDDDDLDDFFMVKPKATALPPPPRRPKPPKEKKVKKRNSDELEVDNGPARRKKVPPSTFSLSSDDDDNFSFMSDKLTPSPSKKKPTPRPLTPPPEPDFVAQAAARKNLQDNVRNHNGRSEYAATPVDIDDDEDLEELDPALAKIQYEIAKRGAAPAAAGPSRSSGSKVQLAVAMVANPTIIRNDSNRRGLAVYERPFNLILGTDEPFERVFQQVAAQRGLAPTQVVLSYKDHRIYPSATPSSLGIYVSASINGYKTVDWLAVLDLRKKAEQEAHLDSDIEVMGGDDDIMISSPAGNGKQLVLRGRGGDEYTCLVQPKNTFRTLLRTYLAEYDGVDKMDRARLEFDGDTIDLSLTVAEMPDIESGDALDVVVL